MDAAKVIFMATVAYVRQRRAFSQPVAHFGDTRFESAKMSTESEVTRAFVDQAVLAYRASELPAVDAAKTRLWCAEMSSSLVDRRVQLQKLRIHGRTYGGPGLPGHPGTAHLRRNERDYAGDHRPRRARAEKRVREDCCAAGTDRRNP
jgi:alkylation response protein AidB-like acyl-CoA dehydrogenase